jgi:hypothetical protein
MSEKRKGIMRKVLAGLILTVALTACGGGSDTNGACYVVNPEPYSAATPGHVVSMFRSETDEASCVAHGGRWEHNEHQAPSEPYRDDGCRPDYIGTTGC